MKFYLRFVSLTALAVVFVAGCAKSRGPTKADLEAERLRQDKYELKLSQFDAARAAALVETAELRREHVKGLEAIASILATGKAWAADMQQMAFEIKAERTERNIQSMIDSNEGNARIGKFIGLAPSRLTEFYNSELPAQIGFVMAEFDVPLDKKERREYRKVPTEKAIVEEIKSV